LGAPRVTLLVSQRLENQIERLAQIVCEDRLVACLFVIERREPNRIQQRVDFEFFFGDFVFRSKRVGVRIFEDALCLARQDAAQQRCDCRILAGQIDVG
jgi:hypothetical protein